MTVEELIAMLEMQEEILQFNHFTNEDAWELGNIMVAEARRRKMPVVICSRRLVPRRGQGCHQR